MTPPERKPISFEQWERLKQWSDFEGDLRYHEFRAAEFKRRREERARLMKRFRRVFILSVGASLLWRFLMRDK